MILRILEVLGGLLATLFVVTQMIIPAWRGQRLFPLFRKQGELERKLADAVQGQEDAKLKDYIKTVKHPKPEAPPAEPPPKPTSKQRKK